MSDTADARETAEEEFSAAVDDAAEAYVQDRIAQHATITEINRELELLLTVECMHQIDQREELSPTTNIHRICEQTEYALRNLAVFTGAQLEGSEKDFPTLASITEHLAHIYVGTAVNAMKNAGVSDADIQRVIDVATEAGKSVPKNKTLETPGTMRN